jgi:Phage tail tube protein
VDTHVLTPIDSANPPYLSIEENLGGSLETSNYKDCVVDSVSLECAPDGYLMGSAGIIARHQTAGATKTASPPLVDTSPLLVGTSMVIDIGGVTTYVTRDWSFEFSNNYEDDVFSHGSVYLADLTPKRRELTMSTTIRPVNNTLWREAVLGASAATTAQSGAAATKAVNVYIETFAEIGASGTPYSIEIDIPEMTISPFNIEPSGDDVIEYEVEFTAVRTTSTPLATVTIKNHLATVL